VFGRELPPATHIPEFNQKQIKIFPNPATDFISIETPLNDLEHNKLRFMIYDVHGKLLKQDHLITRSINISEFETGMYILKIVDDNNRESIFYNKFFVFH
jgi:hypothetical protein